VLHFVVARYDHHAANRTGGNQDIMKSVKWIVILFAVYVGIVVVFESLLGYFQPSNEGTLTITTTADGESRDRVLARVEVGDKLYVAVNHWPRNWYYRALAHPDVAVTKDGVTGSYVAVAVEDPAEYDTVNRARPLGLGFRFLTGFPPRYFIRLDPVDV
jgi:F420H(2)-dependent quinone reductase